ncbi:SLAM family member 9 [Camelus dromedarius]|uniref:SLAM family member 9 n=1 Tax=Camelus dromedarius TaxID=9838 RepID=A0A5N4CN21_CAMDR|nr:SLAM family member 9 [Camelus dromedarius]
MNTGELSHGEKISPLGPQDSGPYRAWMTLHTPPINITKDFTLRIYGEEERLQEPTITVSSQIMKDGTCFITLACSLDQAGEDLLCSLSSVPRQLFNPWWLVCTQWHPDY